MKKKIIVIVAMCAIILAQFNIDVYADNVITTEDLVSVSDLPQNSFDSLGRVTSGAYIVNSLDSTSNQYATQFFAFTPGQQQILYMYFLYNTEWGRYPYELQVISTGSYSRYIKQVTYNDLKTAYDGDGVQEYFEDIVNDPNNYQSGVSGNWGKDQDVITNIPIFAYSDTDAINAYVNNGDISGSLNQNDVKPKPVVPQPYFAEGQGLDSASRTQPLTPNFTDSMKYLWTPGSNDNYTYENMGFDCYLTVNLVYTNRLGMQIESTYQSATYSNVYPGSNPFANFSKDILNAGLASLLGDEAYVMFVDSGYIVTADFNIRNYDKNDTSNKSAWVYFKYNFLNKNSSTNNTSNDNNNTTEESTEDVVISPNGNSTGSSNGSSSSANASAGSASASATGGTTNNNNTNTNNNDPTFTNNNDPTFTNNPSFTNNPTYEGNSVTNTPTYNGNTVTITNSKGFWDLIATLLDSEREDKEDIVDGIVSTVKAIPGLLDTLNTFIGGQTAEGDDHPTGGINGLLENLQGTANAFGTAYTTLITGITSVVTAIGGLVNTAVGAVNNLVSSVNGLLSAGSEFGQYITSGFGLLGENGYLAMFGAFFQFLPAEVLTMIKAAVAASCSLMLSKSAISVLKR